MKKEEAKRARLQAQEMLSQKALQALVTLVEAFADDVDTSSVNAPPISAQTITDIGQHLTEDISQALDYLHASYISIESLSTISDYLDSTDIEHLHADGVVIRNLLLNPASKELEKGIYNTLLAPMFINKQLVGVISIGRSTQGNTYTQEEITLVKTVAKLTTQVIEHIHLLNRWTEAQAKELALQEANRRFDAFLSIASHELRTPLTTIKGNIQLAMRRIGNLERTGSVKEEGKTRHRKIERILHPLTAALQRASVQNRMIGDLLDVSRIQANKLALEMQPCNLIEIVSTAVQDIQQATPDRTITLDLRENETVPIIADADRIGQVVTNYVENALKYSPAGKPVEVYIEIVEEEEKKARVSVRDYGPGLSLSDQRHIWERFYRAHGVTVQHGTGAGLGIGLYICHIIIEHHQGQVGLYSEQGKGSTFWFTLPLADYFKVKR